MSERVLDVILSMQSSFEIHFFVLLGHCEKLVLVIFLSEFHSVGCIHKFSDNGFSLSRLWVWMNLCGNTLKKDNFLLNIEEVM